MQKSKADHEGVHLKGDDIQYAIWPVWVVTCWRLHSWTSKMFMRISNLEGIPHTPTCCECEQEISPTVDLRLGPHIPILRIRICTGGPIRVTDLQSTLVYKFLSPRYYDYIIQNNVSLIFIFEWQSLNIKQYLSIPYFKQQESNIQSCNGIAAACTSFPAVNRHSSFLVPRCFSF
jgi:hypothetical protein